MSRGTSNIGQMGKMKHAGHVGRASTLLWLLWPAHLWGQAQPARQPVGADLLQGGELVVEARNFAVATPAGVWQWSVVENPGAAPSQATYICTETASGAELLVTIMDARVSSDRKFVAGFQNSLQESLTAAGFKVVSLDMAESSVPLPGSYHCRWQAVYRDGTRVYGYCYVTGNAVGYVLQHTTTDASEPPAFTEFARTFRLLYAPRPPSGSTLVASGYILLLGSAWGVASHVNRARRRVVLNGGTLGAVLVLIMMIVLIVLGNYAGLAAGLPSQTPGGIAECRVGEALLPLLVAALISRSFRKRKKQEELRWETLRPVGRGSDG
jgi:hypothetical protein